MVLRSSLKVVAPALLSSLGSSRSVARVRISGKLMVRSSGSSEPNIIHLNSKFVSGPILPCGSSSSSLFEIELNELDELDVSRRRFISSSNYFQSADSKSLSSIICFSMHILQVSSKQASRSSWNTTETNTYRVVLQLTGSRNQCWCNKWIYFDLVPHPYIW